MPYPTPPSSAELTSRSSVCRPSERMGRPKDQTTLSRLTASFINELFSCPPALCGQPSLESFIYYALYRTRLAPSVTFAALVLLHRLKTRYPDARGSNGCRLYLAASMIASKVLCDDTFANSSWHVVARGMFSLAEINQMERELFAHLDYRVTVEQQEIDAVARFLYPSRSPLSRSSCNSSTPPTKIRSRHRHLAHSSYLSLYIARHHRIPLQLGPFPPRLQFPRGSSSRKLLQPVRPSRFLLS